MVIITCVKVEGFGGPSSTITLGLNATKFAKHDYHKRLKKKNHCQTQPKIGNHTSHHGYVWRI